MVKFQKEKDFMQILLSVGIETQTAMILTVAMKNKYERMDKAVTFIEKNQNLTPDQIAMEVLRIAMSNQYMEEK